MNRGLWALGLALSVVLASCTHEEQPERRPTPVRIEAVRQAQTPGALRYSAAILPAQRVDLAFKVPGYIGEIARTRDASGRTRILQEGDRVRRGQVLARIRPADFEEHLKQARSQQAEVDAAFAQAHQAFERARLLYERKSLTRPEYEAAKAAYDGVVARRDGARSLVSAAGNALSDSFLTAPMDGVVIKRLIEVGSLVGPGTPGFVVADTAAVKVLFGAPDIVVRRLSLQQPVSIATEAYANARFEGRITSLAPAADPGSLVFDVEVTIPNTDGRLKPGMVASLELAAEPGDAYVTVPLPAVIRSKTNADGYAVYVIEEHEGLARARLRDVTLGDMIGNDVIATAGLRQGERIIVSGATIVMDGDPVEILR